MLKERRERDLQLQMDFPDLESYRETEPRNGNINKLFAGDAAFHNWYRFVLSFPPHLVRHYLGKFNIDSKSHVLDPFCGTGTTLVESRLNGVPSVGAEASPFAHFASSVKINWDVNSKELEAAARIISDKTVSELRSIGIDDNSPFRGNSQELDLNSIDAQAQKLLISNSISPLPLHKTLVLLRVLKEHANESYYDHALLALANALVFKISNLRFGPEVGAGKPKRDFPVVQSWLSEIKKMVKDLASVKEGQYPDCTVHLGDAREIHRFLNRDSIDCVLTSPPYPNEKDYSRTTRLESVVLGFINNLDELRAFKKTLIRSNTRGIYKNDDDEKWVADHDQIRTIAEAIEKRRIELGKTSGFEKLYGKVTLEYFGGMARHFANLKPVLKPGALLAYVVGDQASYLKVMIRTGELLADIAKSLGFEIVDIDLFRKRFATATSSELREEVVILRWPG